MNNLLKLKIIQEKLMKLINKLLLINFSKTKKLKIKCNKKNYQIEMEENLCYLI